jgi:hypothetical protein
MLGDKQVTLPSYEATLGVTIEAAPAAIWPWLMQIGYRRGGLYSYDWLDRLFGYLDAPSADRLLPEWQHLKVGDEIPIGRGGGFPVKAIEPYRSLVLGGHAQDVDWSWELALVPSGAGRTRAALAQSPVDARGQASRPDDARHGAGGVSHDPENAARHQAQGRGDGTR